MFYLALIFPVLLSALAQSDAASSVDIPTALRIVHDLDSSDETEKEHRTDEAMELKPFARGGKSDSIFGFSFKDATLWSAHAALAEKQIQTKIKASTHPSDFVSLEPQRPEGLSSRLFVRLDQKTMPLARAALTGEDIVVKLRSESGGEYPLSPWGMGTLEEHLKSRLKKMSSVVALKSGGGLWGAGRGLPPLVLHFQPDMVEHVMCLQYTITRDTGIPGIPPLRRRVTTATPVVSMMLSGAVLYYLKDTWSYSGGEDYLPLKVDRDLGFVSVGVDTQLQGEHELLRRLAKHYSARGKARYSCSEVSLYRETKNIGSLCIETSLTPPSEEGDPRSLYMRAEEELCEARVRRIGMQCFGRYPAGSVAMYRQFSLVKGEKKEEAAVKPFKVQSRWMQRVCGRDGWSLPIPLGNPAKAFRRCERKRAAIR